jgi:filamentous hemagglutinin
MITEQRLLVKSKVDGASDRTFDSGDASDSNKPEGNYENPGHHDPSSRGPNPYNPNKSVLPENHNELWKNSIVDNKGTRWTKVGDGKKAEYHRFNNDGNGNWHWTGSTNGVTKGGTPKGISKHLVPKEVR